MRALSAAFGRKATRESQQRMIEIRAAMNADEATWRRLMDAKGEPADLIDETAEAMEALGVRKAPQ